MKDWNLARRDLLKTLGVGAACLPLLRAERAFGQTAGTAKNLFIVASGEGYRYQTGKFLPMPGSLMTQTLPDTLSPLEMAGHKGDIILVPKMSNPSYMSCGACGHGAYGTIYYGGPNLGGEYKEPALMGTAGFSVDQVVGDARKAQNPGLKYSTLALQLMIDTYLADGTTGAHRCFWRGAGAQVDPAMDPWLVYSMLFGGSTTPMPAGAPMPTMPDPRTVALLKQNKSILDFVGADLTRFGNRLGTDAKNEIAQHMNSIRDLEVLLTAPPSMNTTTIGPADFAMDKANPAYVTDDANYKDVIDLHFKLGVVALASGITNVVTLQVVDATGDAKAFNFLPGVPGNPANKVRNGSDLHGLAHNPMQGGMDAKQIVDKWFMTKFASLITLMKGAGSLMQETLVVWGNHMESGDTHAAQTVPWLFAGSAGGHFKTGWCGPMSGNSINGALVEICKAMGVPPTAAFQMNGGMTGLTGLG
jgi:hypothetical protein